MEMPQLRNSLVCTKRNLSVENTSKCHKESRENETTGGKQKGRADLAVPQLGRSSFCFGTLSWLWHLCCPVFNLLPCSCAEFLNATRLVRICAKIPAEICWVFIKVLVMSNESLVSCTWCSLGNVHLLLLTWNQREKQEGFLEHGPGLGRQNSVYLFSCYIQIQITISAAEMYT